MWQDFVTFYANELVRNSMTANLVHCETMLIKMRVDDKQNECYDM